MMQLFEIYVYLLHYRDHFVVVLLLVVVVQVVAAFCLSAEEGALDAGPGDAHDGHHGAPEAPVHPREQQLLRKGRDSPSFPCARLKKFAYK